MKRLWFGALLTVLPLFAIQPTIVQAETETIDLKALAKKARPAVMLLVISDANGKEIATGTGFLVSSDGKLITNHHVIEGASSAVAKAENGGLFPVEGVLADDPKNDLVLLKLKGKDLPFLTLANSDKTEVGTRIAVIGSPLGLEGTLSEGIVSALRELDATRKVVQITAAISPGSSGSPVLDSKGEVVGVASAMLRAGQSLNFAIPIDFVKKLVSLGLIKSAAMPLAVLIAGVQSSDEQAYASAEFGAVHSAEINALHLRMKKKSDLKAFTEMLNAAKVLVERFPESSVAYARLGDAYVLMSFWDEGILAYSRAVKLNPSNAGAWCYLGECYTEKRNFEEAIVALQRAVELNSEFAGAWYSLGGVYIQSGRMEDAERVHRFLLDMKGEPAAVFGKALGKAIADARK